MSLLQLLLTAYILGYMLWSVIYNRLDVWISGKDQNEKFINLSQEIVRQAFDGNENANLYMKQLWLHSLLVLIPLWPLDFLYMMVLWTSGKNYYWRLRKVVKPYCPELLVQADSRDAFQKATANNPKGKDSP